MFTARYNSKRDFGGVRFLQFEQGSDSGRPEELVKKIAQPIFLSKLMHYSSRGKKVAKILWSPSLTFKQMPKV
jgi:hypothetical protein